MKYLVVLRSGGKSIVWEFDDLSSAWTYYEKHKARAVENQIFYLAVVIAS